MTAHNKKAKRDRAFRMTVANGWHAYSIPIPRFPVDDESRERIRTALAPVIENFLRDRHLQASTWLLTESLHKDGAIRQLSQHGREWLPNFGLGVWPDREPPRMYEDKDFLDLDYGAPMRKLMHSVVRVGPDTEAALAAWKTMFGTASTILVFTAGPAGDFLASVEKPALEMIVDESFQGFPWYFPLFGASFLSNAAADALDPWAHTITLYLRESEDDGSLLLLSREPLEDLLRASFDMDIEL